VPWVTPSRWAKSTWRIRLSRRYRASAFMAHHL
jgi:hypothetical protein